MKLHLIGLIIILGLSLSCCRLMTPNPSDETIIVLNFDDADASIWDNAVPIMNEFGYNATSFIPTAWMGYPGKLTWEQVEYLEHELNWETGGHTLNHNDLSTLTYAEADSVIGVDHDHLVQHGLTAKTFALPAGHCPNEFFEIIYRYYENVRYCTDLQHTQPIDRHGLGYFPYQSSFTHEDVTDRITRGIANHENMIIIGFHHILEDSGNFVDNCKPHEFREILQWIHDHRLKVMNIKDALNHLQREE